MKKIIVLLVLLLCMTGVVFSAGQKDSGSGGFTIGFVSNNFNDTFQTYINKAAEDFVNETSDLNITFADAQEDVIKQQDLVNTFIAKGVDALIVVPVDTSAMDPITRGAKEAGIPLCYVNRNPFGNGAVPEDVFYVGSQEIIAGELQMKYMGKLLGGKGAVAILMGKLDNEGALKRTEGNEKIIKEQFPDIKVLAKETGNWQRDQGMTLTENWLTVYGSSLKGILANNDEMALGAVEALKAANRTDIYVIGVDAIPDAKTAVENGSLSATVLQDAKGQGRGAAEIVYKVLKGGKPDSVTWVPFVLITPENIGEFK